MFDHDFRKSKMKIFVLDSKEKEHTHEEVELIYILEGEMNVYWEEHEIHMKQKDIFVINANKRHSFTPSPDILFMKFLIPYELFYQVFQNRNIIFWCDSTREESTRYDELRQALNQLLNYYLSMQQGKGEFGYLSFCYQVLNILSVHFLVQSSDKEVLEGGDKFEERLVDINHYIMSNYNQPISLKELSEKLYLSTGYLSRFFKKNYGVSFSEYLTQIRLHHAADELIYTNIPVTRIGYDVGFTSIAFFNKEFKQMYRETPSVFRKKMREIKQEGKEEIEHKKAITSRLENFLEHTEKKEECKDSCSFVQKQSVLRSEKMKPIWKDMINVGAAEDLLRSEIQEHMILLKEALGFQYVRFWHIFSRGMLIDWENIDGVYNFSRLDLVLDFVIQQGFKPHIELGQKPRRIHKNVQVALAEYSEDPFWIENKQWEKLLDYMMKHFIKRYGREEVATWRIEVWWDERIRRTETALFLGNIRLKVIELLKQREMC